MTPVITGYLSHNQHVLLFLCLFDWPVMKGHSELKTVVAAISIPVPSHNASALKGDVQTDEAFFALRLFRCFRIKSRKTSIIFTMLVRSSFPMYQRSSHWKEFREI